MDLTKQLVRCIEDLELAITPSLSKSEANIKQSKGQYDYIPLPAHDFIEQLNAVSMMTAFCRPNAGYCFLDVGCGIGSKLVLMKSVWGPQHAYYGVEYSKQYVDIAKKLNPDADIIHNDAMKETYEKYDVIYFYQPFQDRDKQSRLEELIVNTAKSGAYILANRKQHPKLWTSNKVKHMWGNIIFQKV